MKQYTKYGMFALAITAIAIICYGPYVTSYFACDDFKYLENIVIGGPKAISLGYNAQMRLVSNWAWVPLYWISGTNPIAYNVFSLSLAVANAFLLYILILEMLKVEYLAMVTAILFMMSASGADAIFWKTNFGGLLSLFFNLIALNLYVIYKNSKLTRYYYISIAVFVLAIFSKEDAAALVPLLIIVEILFFDGVEDIKRVLLRSIPYALAVLLYLITTSVTYHILNLKSETWGWFKLRPLYALFGGFSAFFINPDGILKMDDPAIYLTALFVPLSIFLIKDRKLLLFGYLWIVVTFIPSSFTAIGVFDPRSFTSSTSRFYYSPSVGVALVLAVCLYNLNVKLGHKFLYALTGIFLVSLMLINTKRIHERGNVWYKSGGHAQKFLAAIKQLAPNVPPKSYLIIDSAFKPVGWLWQALKVNYNHSDIRGGATFPDRLEPGESIFLVRCDPSTVLPYQVQQLR